MVTVVFDGWDDVSSFNAVRGPYVALVDGLVNNILGASWS